MMIGPEPTIRMRCRSLRRGMSGSALHELYEIVKQIVRIVRSGCGLGMILHAKYRMSAMAKTFQSIVVQIGVRDLDLVQVQRFGIDGEAVIVRCNLDATADLVEHRMIGAAVSEFQLEGFPAECQAGDLLAKANAEDRHAADQFADF